MATVFEMARALGEELQKTPQVEALLAAKEAYENDPEVSKLVAERGVNWRSWQKCIAP